MTDRISTEGLQNLIEAATPGPWSFEDPMGPEILTIVANCNADPYDWVWVAQVDAEQDDERNDDRSQEEHEANAHLLALAPHLAGEVIRLRKALAVVERECGSFTCSMPDETEGTIHDLINAALKGDAA